MEKWRGTIELCILPGNATLPRIRWKSTALLLQAKLAYLGGEWDSWYFAKEYDVAKAWLSFQTARPTGFGRRQIDSKQRLEAARQSGVQPVQCRR